MRAVPIFMAKKEQKKDGKIQKMSLAVCSNGSSIFNQGT